MCRKDGHAFAASFAAKFMVSIDVFKGRDGTRIVGTPNGCARAKSPGINHLLDCSTDRSPPQKPMAEPSADTASQGDRKPIPTHEE